MNVLIVAIGSQGDVNPFLKIGMALQGRGHEVTILSNSYFKKSVQDAGLGFAPVGTTDEYHKMVDAVDTKNPTKTVKVVMDLLYFNSMQIVYDTIRQLNVPGQTVVLGITMAFGARIAQEKLGIPMITFHLAPNSIPSVVCPSRMDGFWMPHWMPMFYKAFVWRFIDLLTDLFLGPRINKMRQNLGLPKTKKILRQWLHSPDKVIGLFPAWFVQPQQDWPKNTQTTDFVLFDEADNNPIPTPLEEFIRTGDPPVVFTAGSAVNGARAFFKASVEACELLNIRGVFLSKFADHIPDNLPPNIHFSIYAPFSKLLPHASALVHHGGVGSCAQAMRAGVPQLVTPFGMDQPDNARRLSNLGIGAELRLKQYKGPAVADRLGHLLGDQEVRTRCQKVAHRFKNSDPLVDICRIIENQANN